MHKQTVCHVLNKFQHEKYLVACVLNYKIIKSERAHTVLLLNQILTTVKYHK